MPRPSLRVRSKKRHSIASPGGGVKVHYKPKKTKTPLCSICRRPLSGVPRSRLTARSKLSKTAKRPERIYGGQICSVCLQLLVKTSARG